MSDSRVNTIRSRIATLFAVSTLIKDSRPWIYHLLLNRVVTVIRDERSAQYEANAVFPWKVNISPGASINIIVIFSCGETK